MGTLKAVLGPTNTGKTHYAIERMVGHASGMIGLPLRLLAREVYDRVVKAKGERAVALITGEERIEPPTARYWICTVESMPVHKRVEFLAVDEIQLAGDEDRGHVFTDRILHARGTQETLLLGAETMRGVLRDLDLDVDSNTRERFSQLHYAGPTKITKLPKRSAVVAFSTEQVYAIGELLKRQKGGAAIVMGALSPRTRNAQVALYQSGEVDYLVATDAIGMGLNLDVERIAFAARSKFDGRRNRWLSAAEAGQIAGRAGRFRTDGEFGETGDCPPFEEELVHAIETNQFEPVDDLQWRNSKLDYRSIKTLIASLARPSGHPVLRQNPHALDEWVLRRMAEDEAIGPEIRGERKVRRLWDLARLPDFRKSGHEGHGRLVLGLAETLADPDARLGDVAMEKRLDNLEANVPDISSLQHRLAMIRTWTYAAHREDWLENPAYWREKTREIEDRLSDALHAALTLRFVDRRTTALLAGLKREDLLLTELSDTGEVTVEGHVVGRLVGLHFEPASTAKTLEGKAVRSAAITALGPILAERLGQIAGAPGEAFALSDTGTITWKGEEIARLKPGPDWLSPRLELIGAEDAEAHRREAALKRADEWLGEELKRVLPTHAKLKLGETGTELQGMARGLAFRLLESGAAIDLREESPPPHVSKEEREALKAAGLRTGRVAAHVPDAQKPAAQRMIAILQASQSDKGQRVAPEGAGSFELDGAWDDAELHAQGYLRFGKRAVRADLAERLGWEISKRRKEADKPAFELPAELASVISCPGEEFPAVVKGFGLAPAEKDPETGAVTLWRYLSRNRQDGPPRGKRPQSGPKGKDGPPKHAKSGNSKGRPQRGGGRPAPRQPDPDSPFAALASLLPPPPPAPKPKKKKPKKAKTEGAASQQTGKQDNPPAADTAADRPASPSPEAGTDTPESKS
ncbi:helicase [Henriciella barbarensis]|uniref:Helicase n=1 Tax=Henriciella barbarensis TaxID=86342 RepID=A0A399R0C4_9PROT|nr:helicase-related protein [Henriciella barbarensis]RIJ23924.1 helicase [Henriciella barbarensis]